MTIALTSQTYDPVASAVFRLNRARWGRLSNFYPCRMEVNDLKTYHSEGLYQAARFPDRPKLQRQVMALRAPMSAKKLAHRNIGLGRPDWRSTTIETMRWVLRVKLALNWDQFGATLIATKDLSIVEHSRTDRFWGASYDQAGALIVVNALGKLLMELRTELTGPKADLLRIAEPPDVPGLLIDGRPVGQVGLNNQA